MILNFDVLSEKWALLKKKEGDKKTPRGIFNIGNLYYRKDKHLKPTTKLKCIAIKKSMGGVMIPKIKNIITN